MQDALVLTVLGMGVVIIVLYIISLMIRLTGKIVSSRPAKAAPAPAATKAAPAAAPAAAAAAPVVDDAKTIAVIAAAVAAYLGTSPANLVVRPISVSNNWSYVGRIENTRSL